MPPPAAVVNPKRAQWALGLRVLSSVLFVPIFLLLARAGGMAWLGFVALQTVLGLEEFFRMARGKSLRPVRGGARCVPPMAAGPARRPPPSST